MATEIAVITIDLTTGESCMSALVLLKVQTMHVQHRYQDETNLKCRNTDHSQYTETPHKLKSVDRGSEWKPKSALINSEKLIKFI